MMKTRILRFFIVASALFLLTASVAAQAFQTYVVKKGETVYGIARSHGLTEHQLRQANAGMDRADYVLKEGDVINIPTIVASTSVNEATNVDNSLPLRATVRLGVLLPLNKDSNDGKRMIEYYRGVLMACEQLKQEGCTIDVYAWNLAENGDVKGMLQKVEDARLNILIGPYYQSQVGAVSQYCKKNDVLMVLPSDVAPSEIKKTPCLFQTYQSPSEQNETTARRCADYFKNYHPIIIDCKDDNSTKGAFTKALRKQFDSFKLDYNLTSLQSSEDDFARAFSGAAANLVILNTASSAALQQAFDRISALRQANPHLGVAVFGYEEWLGYTRMIPQFYANDVYVPTTFFTNMQSDDTQELIESYRQNFNQDILPEMPFMMLTGYDHAMFFMRGYAQHGSSFDGAAGSVNYKYVQTPLKFERQKKGGLLNRAFMFMHYRNDGQLDALNY